MSIFNSTKYKNEYNKNAYDRLIINVPKGQKAEIEEYRKAKGYSSLNAFINELIRKEMQGETVEEHNTVIVGRDNKGFINM